MERLGDEGFVVFPPPLLLFLQEDHGDADRLHVDELWQ
jgi:hypothetical protein